MLPPPPKHQRLRLNRREANRRVDLTRQSSAAASERSPREAVRHRRGARTGEHREHANQSALAISESMLITKGEETNRLDVGCSGFHEKAVKFEIQFTSLALVVRLRLGSG